MGWCKIQVTCMSPSSALLPHRWWPGQAASCFSSIPPPPPRSNWCSTSGGCTMWYTSYYMSPDSSFFLELEWSGSFSGVLLEAGKTDMFAVLLNILKLRYASLSVLLVRAVLSNFEYLRSFLGGRLLCKGASYQIDIIWQSGITL